MPQFMMDGKLEPSFQSLDEFTQGYIEALFFTNSGDREDELNDCGFSDFAPETLDSIIADCRKFQKLKKRELARAYKMKTNSKNYPDYTPERAGHDFWFTRNGHGVGFWDRGLGNVGGFLSDACGWRTPFGNLDAYLGDDGKIYLS